MAPYTADLEKRYLSKHPIRTFYQLMGAGTLRQLWQMALYALKMSPQLFLPLIIAESIRVAGERPDNAWRHLLMVYGAYLICSLANIPLHMWFIKGSSRIIRGMELRIRAALVRRLQHLSMRFHSERERGRLQSKVLRDVEQLVQLGELYYIHAMGAVIGLIFAFGYTLWKDPLVALGFLIATPIAVTMIYLFRESMGKRNDALRSDVESMSQRLLEMIDMVPVTRAHGLEETEMREVGHRLESVREKGQKVDLINALFGACAFVVFMISIVAVVAGVTWLVLEKKIGLDKIALYAALFQMVVNSVQGILGMIPQISKGFASIRSIGEVLECPDLEENEGKEPVHAVHGAIDFRSVSFTYPTALQAAVRDFSLEVKPGQCVAFVGASGSGKSTLMQLTIGFLRPDSGAIHLDGKPMQSIDMRTWRRHIAMVPQQTILFSGTLRENLTYGLSNYSDEEVDRAIEAANLTEVVEGLPDGLDTLVGENGLKLSGGQRQRLAIARAIIRNPKVIILDEATSALDVVSEREVQIAIENLVRHRTTFIVAHRLSTIRQADLVVVMQNGAAVEIGTQQELMARGGAFTRLKSLQSA
jgi:ATP-binding cassette subfamily B protein